jgi:hypothetical protein
LKFSQVRSGQREDTFFIADLSLVHFVLCANVLDFGISEWSPRQREGLSSLSISHWYTSFSVLISSTSGYQNGYLASEKPNLGFHSFVVWLKFSHIKIEADSKDIHSTTLQRTEDGGK